MAWTLLPSSDKPVHGQYFPLRCGPVWRASPALVWASAKIHAPKGLYMDKYCIQRMHMIIVAMVPHLSKLSATLLNKWMWMWRFTIIHWRLTCVNIPNNSLCIYICVNVKSTIICFKAPNPAWLMCSVHPNQAPRHSATIRATGIDDRRGSPVVHRRHRVRNNESKQPTVWVWHHRTEQHAVVAAGYDTQFVFVDYSKCSLQLNFFVVVVVVFGSRKWSNEGGVCDPNR